MAPGELSGLSPSNPALYYTIGQRTSQLAALGSDILGAGWAGDERWEAIHFNEENNEKAGADEASIFGR